MTGVLLAGGKRIGEWAKTNGISSWNRPSLAGLVVLRSIFQEVLIVLRRTALRSTSPPELCETWCLIAVVSEVRHGLTSSGALHIRGRMRHAVSDQAVIISSQVETPQIL